MTDEEKNAEIARKMAEIIAEAHRLAAESEAILDEMQRTASIQAAADLIAPHFRPQLRLIQGGRK